MCKIVLKPTKTVTGKILDRQTKKPVPHEEVLYGYDVYTKSSPPMFLKRTFGGRAPTDDKGSFTIAQLVSDEEYHIAGHFKADAETPIGLKVALTNASTKASTQVINLGVFYRSRLPKASAYDMVINSSFSSTQSLEQRFQERLNESRIGHLRPLILIGSPTAVSTQPFFEALYTSRESRELYNSYWLIAIPTTGTQAAEAERFVAQNKFTFPKKDGLWMAVLDEKGERLAEATEESLSTDGKIDAGKVLTFLKQNALDPSDAQQMLDSALAQAKQENKRVFVIEGATWCGPCWKLNSFLDTQKILLEKDYILLKLDQRLSGTEAVMNNLRQGAESGIPWYAVLDHDGQPMTSSLREGHNIGFPSDKDGYSHFIDMLDQTRQRLTPEDLVAIKTAVEIKK
ncbi:hypothetical protein A6X21_12410 [Planctopirus hydrillae]|uniref:Thioredoxin domain-containing protein n=2 Tax=Planctopirus hydrillae TaxID=1841610 RepID=A0A1C3E5I0_9PLAN|nr:hypothetical protein A6X21_12410 [Planctopirus hydrillae]